MILGVNWNCPCLLQHSTSQNVKGALELYRYACIKVVLSLCRVHLDHFAWCSDLPPGTSVSNEVSCVESNDLCHSTAWYGAVNSLESKHGSGCPRQITFTVTGYTLLELLHMTRINHLRFCYVFEHCKTVVDMMFCISSHFCVDFWLQKEVSTLVCGWKRCWPEFRVDVW